jgi:hypothetical protein
VRYSLPLCLALVLACSGAEIRSTSAGERLPDATTTGSLTAPDSSVENEQPTVMFRCEQGSVGAYIVTSPSGAEPTQDQMVRISLDSALDC